MQIYRYKPFPWQSPVITEGHSFNCLKKNPLRCDVNYLAVPWAPIIDNLNFGLPKNKKKSEDCLKEIKGLGLKGGFTICQSYRYREITKILRRIGIDTVFSPHAIDEEEYHNGVKIEPLPLFAVNVPKPVEKDIFYSFVGAYNPNYVSDIRLKIFEDNHPESTVVIQRRKWQFNDAVYGEQLRGIATNSVQSYIAQQHTDFYNNILSRTRFSLCPSGAGPASIRFFESLGAGAIPVFLADGWSLPKIKSVDWDKCTIKIPEKNYNKMKDILLNINETKENELRKNCYKAYRQISGKNFVKCIREYYE